MSISTYICQYKYILIQYTSKQIYINTHDLSELCFKDVYGKLQMLKTPQLHAHAQIYVYIFIQQMFFMYIFCVCYIFISVYTVNISSPDHAFMYFYHI